MERVLKVNDFFCGCGGMGIAFKNAGYEIAGAWDFDKYAVQTYKENVGDHVKQTDIREMTHKDVPKADVWAFGFPCQDLSVAGKQKGMILKCEGCGEEIEIKPEEYNNQTICPVCGGDNFKAASRSGMFFEMMRLLEETEQNTPENMPAVIIAENVRGLKPYLPVLRLEYERHGYTAHVEMFNSKYWGVPQNRERYAVVGTRDRLNLQFAFPKEQHEFVPKLSDFIEEDVDEKYYLTDEKAQTIINQALEKLEAMGKCHACITPDRINKQQNGPRAKAEEEPMFTLTAQDIHGIIIETPRSVKLQNSNMRGRRVKEPEEVTFSLTSGDVDGVIVLEKTETEQSIVTAIAEETGLLDPDGYNKAIEQGGGQRLIVAVNQTGKNVTKITDVAPCLMARDYKGFSKKAEMIVIIEQKPDNPQF